MHRGNLILIKGIDLDRVAHVLNRVSSSDPDDVTHCDNVTAGMYYETLSDIADTIIAVRDIFNNIPEELVCAAGMSLSLEYRDDIISGVIRVTGGVSSEKTD